MCRLMLIADSSTIYGGGDGGRLSALKSLGGVNRLEWGVCTGDIMQAYERECTGHIMQAYE
jgi:hypothetical protein